MSTNGKWDKKKDREIIQKCEKKLLNNFLKMSKEYNYMEEYS